MRNVIITFKSIEKDIPYQKRYLIENDHHNALKINENIVVINTINDECVIIPISNVQYIHIGDNYSFKKDK